MRAAHYERIFRNGNLGSRISRAGGYSDEDMARIAVMLLAEGNVAAVSFHMYDQTDIEVTSTAAFRKNENGTVTVQEHKGFIDTRCHHPSCVARGRCTYGNEAATR